MKTKLEEINYIIKHYSAIEFADMMLKREKEASTLTIFNIEKGICQKKVPYEKFMQETWGNNQTPLKELIERSRDSKLNQYAKYITLLTGFNSHGKVFVLNRKEKVVSFLFGEQMNDQNKKVSKLYVHYNPLNVDYISQTILSEYLSNNVLNDQYDISQKEENIIKECDLLLGISV